MNLSPGQYRATCIEAKFPDSEEGKEHIELTFAVLGLADGSPLPGYEQPTLRWRGYFTEKSRKITIKALRQVGWTGDDLSDLSSIRMGAGGIEVELDVVQENYQGKDYLKVAWINPKGGRPGGAAMPEDRKKAFAAKMRGAVLKLGQEDPACRADAVNKAADQAADATAFEDQF